MKFPVETPFSFSNSFKNSKASSTVLYINPFFHKLSHHIVKTTLLPFQIEIHIHSYKNDHKFFTIIFSIDFDFFFSSSIEIV